MTSQLASPSLSACSSAHVCPAVPPPFFKDKHVDYILKLNKKSISWESFEACVTEHLKVSAVYWVLCTMDLLGHLHDMDLKAIVEFVKACQHPDGGFGGNAGHDPHMLYTLSAIQCLALCDAMHVIDHQPVINWISSRQKKDGSFEGDKWGEIDTRFSYCALSCLSLLQSLNSVNVSDAASFINSCKNFDGGFGCSPGAETHGGQGFCCVGALCIANSLDYVDRDLLGWWLAERQLPCGGLNGRPEKKPDVCYSWWNLSAMIMLQRLHWINGDELAKFILECQDKDDGGIADRPEDQADIFHTYFGVAGLSLLGKFDFGIAPINPIFALPTHLTDKLGLPNIK